MKIRLQKLKRRLEVKKYRNIVILNIIIILCAVVCYSPGFLCLRPSDIGIFRAGMSIIMGIVLIFAFGYGNYQLLKEPQRKRVSKQMVSDIDKAEALLKTYFDGKYFGKMAKTASEQLNRMLKSFGRTQMIIDERFGADSLSGNKYYSIVEAAKDSALNNIVVMANRMQMFDEAEYARLQNYKNDELPDDIQERQIELYNSNLERIKASIVLNEKILLSIDNLLMELSSNENDNGESDELLEEIEQLTKEAKLYQ